MIILNEKEYAEKCIREKTIDGKPFNTLSILAKYYYHHCQYKPKKIRELLKNFMSESYELYDINKDSWDISIEKIVKNVRKYKLYEYDGVWVTDSELNVIRNINSRMLERVAFTLLCLAKLSVIKYGDNSGWVNTDISEVFKMANVKCKTIDMYLKLNTLVRAGLLKTSKRLDNLSLKVNFIDNNSENVLFVGDFRDLGLEYLMYIGENYTRCKECGRIIKNNKNRTRQYCNDCSGYSRKKVNFRIVKCIDCGKEFTVSANNRRAVRCEDCAKIKRREDKKVYMRNYRNETREK